MAKKKEISIDDINHLAELTRLQLTPQECAKYTSQMNATVDYIENLQQLNTDNVLPTNNGLSIENICFEDGIKSTRTLTQEQALKNSKNKSSAYFIVKKIM